MAAKQFTIHKSSHTGITVASLDDALKFWEGVIGGKVLYKKTVRQSPEMNIIGIPDAVMNIALLSIPGDYMIELLEYTSPQDRKSYKPRACDVGNIHVALEVEDTKALIEEAEQIGWRAVNTPQKLQRGDGTMWTAIYMFSPDGVTVELLEKLEGR